MKKAAIFVEGQTEVIFVRKLVEELAGAVNITFVEEQRHGAGFKLLRSDVVEGRRYEILIVDCRGDGAVASAINERHAQLTSSGYEIILGLRDLYPLTHDELNLLAQGQASILPATGAICAIVVAVAEVEAWFIQENTHFQRIDASLTQPEILEKSGYDIDADLAENLVNPAAKLHEIYKIANKSYNKKRKNSTRTVDSLDFNNLYLEKRNCIPSFDSFVMKIEEFFI